MVTNDDVRTPSVLSTVEKYIATYPICDLADGMELLVPHGPQPDEHMFSLIINHKSCMAGYNLKDVMSTKGMKADHSTFNPMGVYTLLTRVLSEQTAKDVLELSRKTPKSRRTSSERRAGGQMCPSLVSSWYLPIFWRLFSISHSILDNLKSGSHSTVPFSKQECEDLLDAMSRINCEKSGSICPYSPSRFSFS